MCVCVSPPTHIAEPTILIDPAGHVHVEPNPVLRKLNSDESEVTPSHTGMQNSSFRIPKPTDIL